MRPGDEALVPLPHVDVAPVDAAGAVAGAELPEERHRRRAAGERQMRLAAARDGHAQAVHEKVDGARRDDCCPSAQTMTVVSWPGRAPHGRDRRADHPVSPRSDTAFSSAWLKMRSWLVRSSDSAR